MSFCFSTWYPGAGRSPAGAHTQQFFRSLLQCLPLLSTGAPEEEGQDATKNASSEPYYPQPADEEEGQDATKNASSEPYYPQPADEEEDHLRSADEEEDDGQDETASDPCGQADQPTTQMASDPLNGQARQVEAQAVGFLPPHARGEDNALAEAAIPVLFHQFSEVKVRLVMFKMVEQFEFANLARFDGEFGFNADVARLLPNPSPRVKMKRRTSKFPRPRVKMKAELHLIHLLKCFLDPGGVLPPPCAKMKAYSDRAVVYVTIFTVVVVHMVSQFSCGCVDVIAGADLKLVVLMILYDHTCGPSVYAAGLQDLARSFAWDHTLEVYSDENDDTGNYFAGADAYDGDEDTDADDHSEGEEGWEVSSPKHTSLPRGKPSSARNLQRTRTRSLTDEDLEELFSGLETEWVMQIFAKQLLTTNIDLLFTPLRGRKIYQAREMQDELKMVARTRLKTKPKTMMQMWFLYVTKDILDPG